MLVLFLHSPSICWGVYLMWFVQSVSLQCLYWHAYAVRTLQNWSYAWMFYKMSLKLFVMGNILKWFIIYFPFSTFTFHLLICLFLFLFLLLIHLTLKFCTCIMLLVFILYSILSLILSTCIQFICFSHLFPLIYVDFYCQSIYLNWKELWYNSCCFEMCYINETTWLDLTWLPGSGILRFLPQ